jgi:Short C-terminal domain
LTSFMASATGGGRTGHFAFVDIVSVEYNSGWVSGVLEIHTAAHNAAQSGGYWRMSKSKDDSRSPWELPNVLPLNKGEYEKARPYIERMREMIAAAKRPSSATSVDIASQIERLAQLKASGALSEDEFESAKRRLIAG